MSDTEIRRGRNNKFKKLIRKIISFAKNFGSDPKDTEEVRTLKRIWTIALLFATPISFIMFLAYSLLNRPLAEKFWLIHTIFWGGSLVLFGLVRRGIEWFALSSQTFLVLISFIMTISLGGLFNSDGAVFLGLIGVLYAMVFPKLRRALYLFILYLALIGVAVFLESESILADKILPDVDMVLFWLTFIIVASFTIIAIYYFVNQRHKAFKLLGREKEKSEKLLRRIERDVEMAAQIQRDFLPKKSPQHENFEIDGTNIPCYQVGGDYYDFIAIDSDRLGIVIADVSGKGMGASLLMASLRAALHTEIHPQYKLEEMTAKLNDFVHRSSALNCFITFFFCELNKKSGELKYINAGHNPPLVLERKGKVHFLESCGFCLGMFPSVTYESRKRTFNTGDMVLLFTDGITESRNKENEEFDVEKLVNLLRNNSQLSSSKLIEKICYELDSFTTGADQMDDRTLVVIKRSD